MTLSAHSHATGKSDPGNAAAKWILGAVYALATVQVVWFYLTRVRCYVNLQAFEQGTAPNPFQQRVLLMYPLRWAHDAVWLQAAAAALSRLSGWFPHGVRPEGLLEAAVDLLSLAAGGLAARALYRRASPTRLFSAYIYPLTLIMCASTYSHLAYHAYRFVADLPSMACFSVGMLLLYKRASWFAFAAVFVLGTTNRETTLLLLVFYALDLAHNGTEFRWKQLVSARALSQLTLLLAWWMLWHLCVTHRFQGNASVAQPRLGLNLGILATPLAWPQLFGVFAFVLPAVLFYRSHILDARLRAWLWALPCWLAFMLYFGLLVEVRIFGELIPYMACVAALAAEGTLLKRVHGPSAGFVAPGSSCNESGASL